MAQATLRSLYDLTGRIAVVTGGGTGIGLSIAHGLAASGARVYITGRRVEVLQKAAREWKPVEGKGCLIPLPMDATKKDSILEAKKSINEQEGKLHILVNNAGQTGPTSPWMDDPKAPENQSAEAFGQALFNEPLNGWSDIYAINTFSTYFVTTAFLGLLDKVNVESGPYTASVINVTSISALWKLAQCHFAYNSSKAAASHLSKMMATEFSLKGFKVRVNAIAPGPWASEMTSYEDTPEMTNKIAKGLFPVPAARLGKPEEMAATAIYLASSAAGYMNGQEVVIDGGSLMVNPSTV
ncbi:short-chain dehydrogenase [Fistulina hepatica ATCC 64428]|uniref:Short-chain dehydrogenase n=1 Tax=Fistulina hepatica ATCC 64428 TaxID=1128425 RepID=A0A0D7A1Y7_9AGAR|nr:short-chain dehydrogenase [Fistulina hepatica ATCC 64428]